MVTYFFVVFELISRLSLGVAPFNININMVVEFIGKSIKSTVITRHLNVELRGILPLIFLYGVDLPVGDDDESTPGG